jgi:hypothetical protein
MTRPYPRLNRARALLVGLFAIGPQTCTTTTTTATTHPPGRSGVKAEELAAIVTNSTTPCLTRRPPSPQDTVRAVPQVFVETLLFEVPEGAHLDKQTHHLKFAAHKSDVNFFASPHMIATLNTKANVQLARVYYPPGATPDPGLHFVGMTLLPTLGSSDALILDLDVELQTASQAAPQSPMRSVHLRNTFATKERQAASMVAAVPGVPKTSVAIVIVPYLLRSEADLRDLFECKMQHAEQHRDAAP